MPDAAPPSRELETMPLRTKFWLGLVLPAATLVVAIALVLASGRGRREAPAIVFFASLVAVPALVLVNCWTLFVAWSSRVRLVLSSAALPALFVLGAVAFVHGADGWQKAGMLVLAPFMHFPMRHVGLLAAAWLGAVLGLLLTAKLMPANRGAK